MSELFTVKAIKTHVSWWPYSTDATYRLIRDGKLKTVAVGRRRWLTSALIEEFVSAHVANVGGAK